MSLGLKEYKGKKIKVFASDNHDSDFNRDEWRNDIITRILVVSPKLLYKHLDHLIVIKDGEFYWDDEKIKNLDDVALQFIKNIASNGLLIK